MSANFNVLSLDALKNKVPSIFSVASAPCTSDKYKHISTIHIVAALKQKGFMPTSATQSNCRLACKKDFTKHLLRFRHHSAKPTENGLYPEIVLINSHDGLSSYKLMAGVYRIVCSNGLIAGNSYEDIRVRHQGDIVGEVIDGTYQVIETSQKLIKSANQMSSVLLNEQEKHYFAEAAHAIRFEESEVGNAITPGKLLMPRRGSEFNKNDLFTVFNVVQENLIKGGIRGFTKDSNGYTKRISTRAIKGIDHNTTLNRALWTLGEKMMELKK